jgi:hypothetical protein
MTFSKRAIGVSSGFVHSRIGAGPIVRSVASIELVLADGSLVTASPTENSELFYAAIGGYGGIGVIVTATLNLADNTRIQRQTELLSLSDYAATFGKRVRENQDVVFHNGDLYGPDFDTVRAQSWLKTQAELTTESPLSHSAAPGSAARALLYWICELPFGHAARRYLYDSWVYSEQPVVMRNHEASYDVIELEPESRVDSTYVLQEYFVPVAQLEAFVPKLRAVFTQHHAKIVNVSIRHALPDPGTLLAWAPEEVFSFVVYYKQATTEEARAEVAAWTRAAIDAALSVGGRYYLPYQPHATLEQFKRAYPGFEKFAALKQRVDPQHRFRNLLWDKYLPPDDAEAKARALEFKEPEALRNEGQTFLTLPEWYIVFSAEEYQRHLATQAPSAFPYFRSIGQFWTLYRKVIGRTRDEYPLNTEYHVMNVVIGLSYSLENVIKGVYEGSVGRLFEWSCTGPIVACSAEDAFAADAARAYDTFVRTYPWYEFPFRERASQLWQLENNSQASRVRAVERRLYLSAEYGLKALYAGVIRKASQGAYGVEAQTTRVWLSRPAAAALPANAHSLGRFDNEEVLELPRYEGFRDALQAIDAEHTQLRQVAGNERIALSVVIPHAFKFRGDEAERVVRWPVLTDTKHDRALLYARVDKLLPLLSDLKTRGAAIDHVFDF